MMLNDIAFESHKIRLLFTITIYPPPHGSVEQYNVLFMQKLTHRSLMNRQCIALIIYFALILYKTYHVFIFTPRHIYAYYTVFPQGKTKLHINYL